MDNAADFEAMRHAMVVSQLRTNAVDDARVVAAMARVPRERFVPAEIRGLAYRDTALPLGGGRALNPPIATGRLLARSDVAPGDRVLLIGAAGGYTAAVLAELGAQVTAVESDPALAALAHTALADVAAVTVAEGPLASGAPDGAPYDLLFVDGGVERLPDDLVAQLRQGGRIATGLVDRGVTRLAVGARSAGGVGLRDFADVECAVLPGFAAAPAFSF